MLQKHLPVIPPLNHGSRLQKENRLLKMQFKESWNTWPIFTLYQANHFPQVISILESSLIALFTLLPLSHLPEASLN